MSAVPASPTLALPEAPGMTVGTFKNGQGLSIATYAFDPVGGQEDFGMQPLKGVIILCHGYGECIVV